MIASPPSTNGYTTGRAKADGERTHEHCANQRNRIGFKNVRGHAGAVADVVADIVRDGRGIAGIIFIEALLHLADEVRADIRSFGVNAAAETRKDRDERSAERDADEA